MDEGCERKPKQRAVDQLGVRVTRLGYSMCCCQKSEAFVMGMTHLPRRRNLVLPPAILLVHCKMGQLYGRCPIRPNRPMYSGWRSDTDVGEHHLSCLSAPPRKSRWSHRPESRAYRDIDIWLTANGATGRSRIMIKIMRFVDVLTDIKGTLRSL